MDWFICACGCVCVSEVCLDLVCFVFGVLMLERLYCVDAGLVCGCFEWVGSCLVIVLLISLIWGIAPLLLYIRITCWVCLLLYCLGVQLLLLFLIVFVLRLLC